MITEPFFNAIVCLSIATTVPIPTLVRLMIVKGKMEFQDADPLPPRDEIDEETWFENL